MNTCDILWYHFAVILLGCGGCADRAGCPGRSQLPIRRRKQHSNAGAFRAPCFTVEDSGSMFGTVSQEHLRNCEIVLFLCSSVSCQFNIVGFTPIELRVLREGCACPERVLPHPDGAVVVQRLSSLLLRWGAAERPQTSKNVRSAKKEPCIHSIHSIHSFHSYSGWLLRCYSRL